MSVEPCISAEEDAVQEQEILPVLTARVRFGGDQANQARDEWQLAEHSRNDSAGGKDGARGFQHRT